MIKKFKLCLLSLILSLHFSLPSVAMEDDQEIVNRITKRINNSKEKIKKHETKIKDFDLFLQKIHINPNNIISGDDKKPNFPYVETPPPSTTWEMWEQLNNYEKEPIRRMHICGKHLPKPKIPVQEGKGYKSISSILLEENMSLRSGESIPPNLKENEVVYYTLIDQQIKNCSTCKDGVEKWKQLDESEKKPLRRFHEDGKHGKPITTMHGRTCTPYDSSTNQHIYRFTTNPGHGWKGKNDIPPTRDPEEIDYYLKLDSQMLGCPLCKDSMEELLSNTTNILTSLVENDEQVNINNLPIEEVGDLLKNLDL